jgi:cation diffusion facilitator family transporter
MTKEGASRLLIGVVVCLIAIKAVVAWLTGSISIIAQATDSLFDLIAGIVTFLTIRVATRPADAEHPYGHGKVEEIGGMVQGMLIFAAGGLIIYSAIRRIIEGSTIEIAEAGIGVMLFSIIGSVLLSRQLSKVGQATGSVVLEANARNIAADVYSALAVLVGLLVVRLTGINYIDSIIAIAVAVYIYVIAGRVIYHSFSGLVDTRLSSEQEEVITRCLDKYRSRVAGFHKLRTRRAGSQRHIDLHLVVNKEISLEKAHEICDQVEGEIEDCLQEASVTIHIEPCDGKCEHCSAACAADQSI